ncbi:MAG: TldD/PmbA family protein, partial [Acidimicrobiales bacterium]
MSTQHDARPLLNPALLQETIETALQSGATFAEVFVEDKRSTSAVLDDSKIEELTSGRRRGAGIRVILGETTGFAHTADLSPEGLQTAARAAAAAAQSAGNSNKSVAFASDGSMPAPVAAVMPDQVSGSQKVALLQKADQAARGFQAAITQVSAHYADSRRRIQIANSEGLLAGDDQVRTLFAVSCVAQGDLGRQTGRQSMGHTVGFEIFDSVDVESMALQAAQRAYTKLSAVPAPSGEMPVVVGPGGGGVLFHEACGHGLEADIIAKSASVFAGRRGEMVANPMVTLVDDGTMAGEWGRYGV